MSAFSMGFNRPRVWTAGDTGTPGDGGDPGTLLVGAGPFSAASPTLSTYGAAVGDLLLMFSSANVTLGNGATRTAIGLSIPSTNAYYRVLTAGDLATTVMCGRPAALAILRGPIVASEVSSQTSGAATDKAPGYVKNAKHLGAVGIVTLFGGGPAGAVTDAGWEELAQYTWPAGSGQYDLSCHLAETPAYVDNTPISWTTNIASGATAAISILELRGA